MPGKAVASFFTPASQKEPEKLTWKIVNKTLVVGRYQNETELSKTTNNAITQPRKIAAFDLDDTIISPTTGNKWTRSASGWKWWHNSIPTKLKELHAEGFLIILLSNQSTISLKDNPKLLQKDSISLINFKNQLLAILRQFDLPISVYAATGQDVYRKPRTGMWREMLNDYGLDDGGRVKLDGSFYVGDAAGREKTPKRPKDHACSDR
jgi:bifunctional polynucleotide phosphatase/kinase